ncbi:hypothetical protein LTR36_002783 [Oleoguttula mirabilis]|uniref:2EXR domain-containing protein n=1 Tax=Oleoguttula mirabilis TaxID=1507867 RepID=A0AAV9JKD3_9PEZI|nr:hypothetical protein LTR36_002783 [Oleoguttula mirabilis]
MSTTTPRSTAPTSRLMSLPPELRLAIYELALVQPHPLSVSPLRRENEDAVYTNLRHNPRHNPRHLQSLEQRSGQPPLLRVCKQLRTEALSTFWGQNCFRIALDIGQNVTEAVKWVRTLPATGLRGLRYLQLGDQSAGHLIVDLREGRVVFRRDATLREEFDGPGMADEDVGEEVRAWQWWDGTVTRASEEHCRVMGDFVEGTIGAHREEGTGWGKGELVELIGLSREEGRKDRRKRTLEWWG